MKFSKYKRLVVVIIFQIMIGLIGCSSSGSVYNNDYPLSSNFAYSSDSTYSVQIPDGWLQINDNECNCNNILLISEDYKFSITLLPILLDDVTFNNIRNNPVKELVQLNKAIKKSKTGSGFSILDEEQFKVGLTNATAYRYLDNEKLPQRTILFEKQNKFFEVNAIMTEVGAEKTKSNSSLYSIQNAILTSFLIRN